MKPILITILTMLTIFLVLFFIWKSQEARLDRYNKYQCAVVGYREDCYTPLPESERLK